jgi:hypothetical protein
MFSFSVASDVYPRLRGSEGLVAVVARTTTT